MNSHLRGAARGLILGEALSWTGLYQRSHLLPQWTRRKRREIAHQYEQDALVELSLPFALNQPPEVLKPAPGPHAEWFAFQLQVLRQGNGRYSSAKAVEAWLDLIESRHQLRLTISQHAALENLAHGKRPPISGYDNPHYFDDGACFRAIPLAVLMSGSVESLVACVGEDAAISHAEDGLWAAQAYAVTLAKLIETGDVILSLDRALTCLPNSSWVRREVELALAIAEKAETIFDLVERLAREVVNDTYNYGNSAPETVSLAFGILNFTQGDPQESLFAALTLPRTAGSVAPLVGALCGAFNPEAAASVSSTRLLGVSLPQFEGVDLMHLLDA